MKHLAELDAELDRLARARQEVDGLRRAASDHEARANRAAAALRRVTVAASTAKISPHNDPPTAAAARRALDSIVVELDRCATYLVEVAASLAVRDRATELVGRNYLDPDAQKWATTAKRELVSAEGEFASGEPKRAVAARDRFQAIVAAHQQVVKAFDATRNNLEASVRDRQAALDAAVATAETSRAKAHRERGEAALHGAMAGVFGFLGLVLASLIMKLSVVAISTCGAFGTGLVYFGVAWGIGGARARHDVTQANLARDDADAALADARHRLAAHVARNAGLT